MLISGEKTLIKLEFAANCASEVTATGERVTWRSAVKKSGELGMEQRYSTRSDEARNKAHREASSDGRAGRPSDSRRARKCHACSDSVVAVVVVERLSSEAESARLFSMELEI